MATEKRERQRANRDAKRAAEDKKRRRSVAMRRARRIAFWVVLAVAGLFLFNVVLAGSAEGAAALLTP